MCRSAWAGAEAGAGAGAEAMFLMVLSVMHPPPPLLLLRLLVKDGVPLMAENKIDSFSLLFFKGKYIFIPSLFYILLNLLQLHHKMSASS